MTKDNTASWWQTHDPTFIFYKLISRFQPEVIFDVGSRDGTDALRFKSLSPRSRVVAFEAHPDLYQKMLKQQEIESFNLAISNYVGTSEFHIFDDSTQCGSLRQNNSNSGKKISVNTTTLDQFSYTQQLKAKSIGMWIDVEGCGLEALQGAAELLKTTDFIHIEVETKQHWQNQSLETDLIKWMHQQGFVILGYSHNAKWHQGNILFLRKSLLKKIYIQPWFWLQIAKILIKRAIRYEEIRLWAS